MLGYIVSTVVEDQKMGVQEPGGSLCNAISIYGIAKGMFLKLATVLFGRDGGVGCRLYIGDGQTELKKCGGVAPACPTSLA